MLYATDAIGGVGSCADTGINAEDGSSVMMRKRLQRKAVSSATAWTVLRENPLIVQNSNILKNFTCWNIDELAEIRQTLGDKAKKWDKQSA